MMIKDIQERLRRGDCRFTIHAFERCIERDISPNHIKDAILSGEIIEDYPEDKYGASCLVYGVTKAGKILHLQCSLDPVWIITAYDPTLEPTEWEENFKRRRRKL